MIDPLEFLASGIGLLSMTASTISILFTIRSKNKRTGGNKKPTLTPLQKIQVIVFSNLIIYHLFFSVVYLFDMLIFDPGNYNQWTRNEKSRWLRAGMFLSLDMFAIAGAGWFVCFRAKFEGLGDPNAIGKMIHFLGKNEVKVYKVVSRSCLALFISHCVILGATLPDPMQTMAWFDLLELQSLVPMTLISLPILIDMTIMILQSFLVLNKFQHTKKIRFALFKVLIVCTFALSSSLLAEIQAIYDLSGNLKRLFVAKSVDSASQEPYKYDGMNLFRLIFASTGIIVSLPFIIGSRRKEEDSPKSNTQITSQKILNKGQLK